jgi:hypothetical protein
MAAQENTSHLDIIDRLNEKTATLTAMLTMTHGLGFESFNNYSDNIRDSYMQGCTRLSKEIGELIEAVHEAHTAAMKGGAA